MWFNIYSAALLSNAYGLGVGLGGNLKGLQRADESFPVLFVLHNMYLGRQIMLLMFWLGELNSHRGMSLNRGSLK
ncbi:hypothetical protein SLE2022_158460 [Rubroshorea leprosula]